jgi:hypothetical protein
MNSLIDKMSLLYLFQKRATSFPQFFSIIMNSTTTVVESWFIPLDILMIVCTTLTIILSIIFLCIIILDKTCHTVPMMLTANSCLSALIAGYVLLSLSISTFQNDLKQIYFEDSLCFLRAYFNYVSNVLFIHSFLTQSIYRYVTVVYPTHLFWQSAKFQLLVICIKWIFAFVYPFAFLFTGEIIYNVDNQICQIPLRLSFALIYSSLCIYIIPVSMITFIYFKLVRYVKQMSERATPTNSLSRAQRELKMVKRIVILINILVIIGFPYTIFIFI